MLCGKRIAVVLPAYNAARTLEMTVADIPKDVVDEILLVDDSSRDETIAVARQLGLRVFLHAENFGYGRNQKTCYSEALGVNADIVVMVHPDYQYQPKLVLPMAALIASGVYDVVLGSRILGGHARSGGMPLYKYISNRFLTAVQNLLVGAKLDRLNGFDTPCRSDSIDNWTDSCSVHIDWHRRHCTRGTGCGTTAAWSACCGCFLVATHGEPADHKYRKDCEYREKNFTLRYPPRLNIESGVRHNIP